MMSFRPRDDAADSLQRGWANQEIELPVIFHATHFDDFLDAGISRGRNRISHE